MYTEKHQCNMTVKQKCQNSCKPCLLCQFARVGCLAHPFVCLFVRCLHNSKMNHLKVFKLGIGNNLGISYKQYSFGLKDQKYGFPRLGRCVQAQVSGLESAKPEFRVSVVTVSPVHDYATGLSLYRLLRCMSPFVSVPLLRRPELVWYGIVGFNVPIDTLQVISETILRVI